MARLLKTTCKHPDHPQERTTAAQTSYPPSLADKEQMTTPPILCVSPESFGNLHYEGARNI